MKVEATVDVGDNLTGMLEKLAHQLGTTVDKVYPWYVQQATNEGVTALVAVSFVFLMSITFLIVGLILTGSEHHDRRDIGGGIAFFAGIFLLLSVVLGTIEGVNSVRKFMNPNYYAMKMLTRDIGRLTAR